MATYDFIGIDLEEASLLADLNGVKLDLESVKLFARYLANSFASKEIPPGEIVHAFPAAILVYYSRPFMSGVRRNISLKGPLPEILTGLNKKHRKLHEKFMEWRNKHIAHSVNPFKENQVVAHYNDEKVLQQGFLYVSVHQRRHMGFNSQVLAEIEELTTAILNRVDTKIKEETTRLLGVIRQMPITALLANDKKTLGVHRPQHAKSRKKKN